jgi:hypothetical protein
MRFQSSYLLTFPTSSFSDFPIPHSDFHSFPLPTSLSLLIFPTSQLPNFPTSFFSDFLSSHLLFFRLPIFSPSQLLNFSTSQLLNFFLFRLPPSDFPLQTSLYLSSAPLKKPIVESSPCRPSSCVFCPFSAFRAIFVYA